MKNEINDVLTNESDNHHKKRLKNEVRIEFGQRVVNSLGNIIRVLDESNLTVEEIADFISDLEEIDISKLHLIALSSEHKDMANKIDAAIKLLDQRMIDKFRQAVKDGTYEVFLSKFSLVNKNLLLKKVTLFMTDVDSKNYLTEEGKKIIFRYNSRFDK